MSKNVLSIEQMEQIAEATLRFQRELALIADGTSIGVAVENSGTPKAHIIGGGEFQEELPVTTKNFPQHPGATFNYCRFAGVEFLRIKLGKDYGKDKSHG